MDTEPNPHTVVVHLTGRRWYQSKKVVFKDAIGVKWFDKTLIVGRTNGSSATFSPYEVAWVEEIKK